MKISKSKKINLLKVMYRIRYFEEYVAKKYLAGDIPGFLHSYIGQEAIATGFCSQLRKSDYIISTHRGHGHVIAKGTDLKKMMAEIYGKADGCCKGKGGSMHIADFSLKIIGANGIVGGGIPIAAGVGLSILLKESDDVVVCFFGDGAVNQGSFHESLNLASIWKLPVVFVCENNFYAMSTPKKNHINIKEISSRKKSYDIYGKTIDGNNVLEVVKEAYRAIKHAREGKGPCLIECITYRKFGHYIGDPALYKDQKEKDYWDNRDPLNIYEEYLVKNKYATIEELEVIKNLIKKEINSAVIFAKEATYPDKEDALKDLIFGDLEKKCL